MHLPPPPDSRQLLPPLLACLPTAFVSPRPPPALLPLLSPLLRQRLNFLSSGSASRGDGWLPLLSWDAERAAKLTPIVEHMELEPHPVSGEVEMDDVQNTDGWMKRHYIRGWRLSNSSYYPYTFGARQTSMAVRTRVGNWQSLEV